MKKKLRYLVLHCSATPAGRNVQPSTIKKWHTDPVAKGGRGWSKIGYSNIITLDGVVHNMRAYNSDPWVDENEITNGVAGINSISRHICYVGGLSADLSKAQDTRTEAQTEALKQQCLKMVKLYPGILIGGHNQFSPKACPSFDVPAWLLAIGIDRKNIYGS